MKAFLLKAIRFELSMWASLYRWVFRRPVTREPGAQLFGYAWALTPVIIGFIVVSAIEMPIVHMLLPWASARLVSLILSVQGLLWMVGYLASLRVNPHIVAESGLHLRHGAAIKITLPWEAIAAVKTSRHHSLPKRGAVWVDDVLHLGVGNQTNVDVELHEPADVPLSYGKRATVTKLSFYADDPAAIVAAAREKMPTWSGSLK